MKYLAIICLVLSAFSFSASAAPSVSFDSENEINRRGTFYCVAQNRFGRTFRARGAQARRKAVRKCVRRSAPRAKRSCRVVRCSWRGGWGRW